jgi:hypothetical protein
MNVREPEWRSWYSEWAVGWSSEESWFHSRQGMRYIRSSETPDHFWGPSSLVCDMYWWSPSLSDQG